MKYTWKIESIDEQLGTMIVLYAFKKTSQRLNVPIPAKDGDLSAHVHQYAPEHAIKDETEKMALKVGKKGSGQFVNTEQTERPQLDGSWNEEYLRAMIYQVLEEMKEEAA